MSCLVVYVVSLLQNMYFLLFLICVCRNFEDTKVVIKNRKSKDRQYKIKYTVALYIGEAFS